MAIDIEVATKDCTALTDAELAEMADVSAEESAGWEVGFLSKQREDWVLVTQVRQQGKLQGYALATLERIGGTPSLLLGISAFTRGDNGPAVGRGYLAEVGDLVHGLDLGREVELPRAGADRREVRFRDPDPPRVERAGRTLPGRPGG